MMLSRPPRSWFFWLLLAVVGGALAYRALSGSEYEYEEALALDLDGSATVDVSGSIASLVALHGADLDPDPQAETDPATVRAYFAAPGVEVSAPTFYRRRGRRFVHVRLDVADVRRLPSVAPFAASEYQFSRRGDAFVFSQTVGRVAPASARRSGTWTGDERVVYRMHVPSKVLFENASSDVMRGNILVWEQTLSERLAGTPLDLRVEMETESILATTLLLFGATVAAAGAVFVLVIWGVVRKGRRAGKRGSGVI
jgi:hypothetical protein